MTDIFQAFDDLKQEFGERDVRHAQVAAVRRGDVHEVLPGLFPENLPKQVTANMVNIASRQLGEQLGGLPNFSCKDARHASDAAKGRAEKRTKIVKHYVECSRLQPQMYSGADRYLSFGAMPIVVEPDFEKYTPYLRVDSPVGAYWRTDLRGNVIHYYKSWHETAGSLAVKFPEHARAILDGRKAGGGYLLGNGQQETTLLEVVKCYGKENTSIFLPDKKLIVAEAPNPMGRAPVFLAEMPKWDEESRGQFDEMIWVQLFRARMAAYTLEIAHEAVNTPWVIPNDVNELSLGPRTIMRTNNPQGVGRVPLEVPNAAFAENQLLAGEERLAARFPEGMTGNIQASVITGQGVSALLSTVDTQIKVAQDLFAEALQNAASFALEMDETFFGDVEKFATGREDGSRYSIKYTPSKDIKGDYAVECTYGFASGMDANRGLVFMLQGRGGGLLSKETVMDQLASMFGFSSTEEIERMDVEALQEALMAGVQGIAASVPQLAQMGQDPRSVVQQMATLIKARQEGVPVHEAVMKAFEPTPEEQAAAEQQAQDPLAALMGGAAPGGPGGGGERPDMQMMLANLTSSGEASLQNSISRMIPTVG